MTKVKYPKQYRQNVSDREIELGERLRTFRKKAGYTQTQLANELSGRMDKKVAQSMVAELESAQGRVTTDMLVDICDVIGCSADELLGRATPKMAPISNARLKKRVELLAKMGKSDHDLIIKMIDSLDKNK